MAAVSLRQRCLCGNNLNSGTQMNPTVKWTIPAVLVASILSGCLNLTPVAKPEQSHGLALAAESSARVRVNGPWFQMNHGELELTGTVSKKTGASTTAFSHVDILFYNKEGTVVASKPLAFFPKMLGESRYFSRFGYYSLRLDPLPEGAARIVVRAHDDARAAPHS